MKISLDVWFGRINWILLTVYAFSLLCYVILAKANEENQPHTIGKWKHAFVAFSHNCEHDSLILYWNSANEIFLNVSYNVESATTPTNSYSATLKSIGLTFWKYLLFMQDFTIQCISHLENIGLMSCADLPSVDTFHSIASKK